MRIVNSFIFILLVSAFANVSSAAESEREYFSNILRSAEAGNIESQQRAADMYRYGLGVERNAETADFWQNAVDAERVLPNSEDEILKIAELGDVDAQFKLAEIYAAGGWESQTINQAVFWYDEAAKQGSIQAQIALGDLYSSDMDFRAAAPYYSSAAGRGNSYAQNRIGIIIRDGHIDGDAARWFRLAADQGNSDAQYNLGVMYDNGYENALTGQIYVAENDREAVKWFALAAEKGNSNAQSRLAAIIENGYGVYKNILGKDVLRENLLSGESAMDLAEFNFLAGKEIVDDPKYKDLNVNELTSLADSGDSVAQRKLGINHQNEGDFNNALPYLKLAAENEERLAMSALGIAYYNGYGVDEDEAAAFTYYLRAARLGHMDSMVSVGTLYRDGRGVPKDSRVASEWWGLAARLGSYSAWGGLKTLIARNEGLSNADLELDRRLREEYRLNEDYCDIQELGDNESARDAAERIFSFFQLKGYDDSVAYGQCSRCGQSDVDLIQSETFANVSSQADRSLLLNSQAQAAANLERVWRDACSAWEYDL